MKIKRRKKNDRTAFWFMAPYQYFNYRCSINPERRIDKTIPRKTRRQRDRDRAKWLTKKFKFVTPVTVANVLGPPCDP